MNQNKAYKKGKFLLGFKIILRIILFPFVIIYLILQARERFKLKKQNEKQIKFYEKSQLDALSGIEFEICLKALFEKMGYKATLTKTSGDFGADLIIEKNGKRAIVQAKRYNQTVGVRAIQEIVSARAHYKIYDAFVVTNSDFSAEADKLAGEAEVNLICGEFLEKLLTKYDVHIQKMQKNTGVVCGTARDEIMQKYTSWI